MACNNSINNKNINNHDDDDNDHNIYKMGK